MYLPVNKAQVLAGKVVPASDSARIADVLRFNLGDDQTYIVKDQLAMLDIVASNLWERPIYWAVTCREDRLLGLQDYLQLEGLALRLVPIQTPSSMDQYGILGSGRVAADIAYDNIMNTWRWGNFDKERLFVDRSYMPSLQTMRVAFIRICRDLTIQGKNDKAVALADRYFEAFPDFNFTYDQFSALMADVYSRAGAKDKAAAKIRAITAAMDENLRFYDSLDAEFKAAYQSDQNSTLGTIQLMARTASEMGDKELGQELEKKLMRYMTNQPGLPGVQ
jgi:hypothetical protein